MSNQIVISSGAKVRSLNGVITGTTGVLDSLPINAANGIPQLDVNGKILVSQLPNSVMEYKGTWNANTNTPTLTNGGAFNQGDVYLCNVAGTTDFGAGPIAFVVGDQVIYSGSIWQRASGSTGTVTSVAVTETGDALTITGSPITTSGTINVGFAGTSAQYVAGNGALVTFPTLTGYVPYTGATANVDLGLYNLYAQNVFANDTSGNWLASLTRDSFTAIGILALKSNGFTNYLQPLTTVSSARTWSLPNASGTIALTSDLTGGTVTSVGLTMPIAFNVASSPITTSGTLAVTAAGVASQYIRGDGTLADFPSSGGGGSSVSYYLNGGTSQGVIGGTTYYEMSKTADTGTGVDFPKTGNGLIVSFLTDANDPAQLNIPAGNWNYEIYVSMSANGGTPQLYAELYKYDGTTFTLISTSTNEILYDGTTLNLYTFAMAVPTTTLTVTDRLAVKLYATNSGGKTTTVHTQNGHLCQIITTFSTGITALNGLTAQVQYFQVGTSGTDFNISSATATHTFNLPTASAANRGALSSADWTTFNNKQNALNGTGFVKASGTTISYDNSTYLTTSAAASTYVPYTGATTNVLLGTNILYSGGVQVTNGGIGNITTDGYLTAGKGIFLTDTVSGGQWATGTTNIVARATGLLITHNLGGGVLIFDTATTYNYTFPSASGTLALTSNLSSYLPLAGGTLTGALNGTSATFSDTVAITLTASDSRILGGNSTGRLLLANSGTTTYGIFYGASHATYPNTISLVTDNAERLKITNTGAATFSNSVGINGGDFRYRPNGDVTNSPALVLKVATAGVLSLCAEVIGDANADSNSLSFRVSNPTSGRFDALTIASTGNVGIGTNSPSALLHLSQSTTNLNLYLQNTSGSGKTWAVNSDNLGSFNIHDTTANRLTITSGGNVGIGTSSPTTYSLAGKHLELYGGSDFSFFHNNTATVKSFFAINEASLLAALFTFSAHPLTFGTSNTERMRITSGGSVGIGTTGSSNARLTVAGVDASTSNYSLVVNNNTTSLFYVRNDGQITTPLGTGTVYSTSGVLSVVSDMTLKNDDGFIDNALEKVMNLKPRYFHWKEESTLPTDLRQLGFYAQEVNAALGEEAANTPKENVSWGINDRAIIAFLTAAIQEQQQQIEELKLKIK